ncbi:MAG: isoaspartyl peptidase/L-asparaginase [Flavobacteriales bacterium]|jgi:beta-aspartyl-peptidase (threonine type)|nr:isoaspartyl peptidase/L-asparaginase [Flavobacteriales bacterium]
MKSNYTFLTLFLFIFSCENYEKTTVKTFQEPKYALVLHGGAGYITPENLSEEKQKSYKNALDSAVSIGENILKNNGAALDAVVETISYLENNPLFNAGRGAVFTHEGKNELDASIMLGSNKNAGAVGGVTKVKNPIKAAKAVMLQSPHVMLVGKGADQFSLEHNLDTVSQEYFYTERSWQALQNRLQKEQTAALEDQNPDWKYGTVGCVALDYKGNIVAGTSTGGMTNKRWNRIGDSPIIGAATYADNHTCGVSATGHGEYFIRYAVAHDIAAQMEYAQKSLEESAQNTINNKLVKAKGDGGIVALDKNGNISMVFNTPGMFRAYAKPNEKKILMFQ